VIKGDLFSSKYLKIVHFLFKLYSNILILFLKFILLFVILVIQVGYILIAKVALKGVVE